MRIEVVSLWLNNKKEYEYLFFEIDLQSIEFFGEYGRIHIHIEKHVFNENVSSCESYQLMLKKCCWRLFWVVDIISVRLGWYCWQNF